MRGVFDRSLKNLFFKRFLSQRREYLRKNLNNLRQNKAIQLSGLRSKTPPQKVLASQDSSKNDFYYSSQRLTAANALRHHLFNKLTPMMLGACQIEDKEIEEIIQKNCREITHFVEEFVKEYNLDFIY